METESKTPKELTNSLKDLEKNLSEFSKYMEPLASKEKPSIMSANEKDVGFMIEKKVSIGYYLGIAILLLLSVFGFIDLFKEGDNIFILSLMPYWVIITIISGIKSIINMINK
jgi:hypothetical protein